MEAAEAQRAVAAAMSAASALGLVVDEAAVLNDSNRLVVRLLPADVVARVTPMAHFASAEREVELARQLGETGSPIVRLDARVEPRVLVDDGLKISLWTYVEAVPTVLPPTEYAQALVRLHADLRRLDLTVPHFSDRVAATRHDVASGDVTPDLPEADRVLLGDTLDHLARSVADRHAVEQVLHGEPHAGNVLDTEHGPRFMDFENACRGPVEYDLAWVPDEVAARHPDVDRRLLDDCRGIVLAIIATHRWTAGDEHPSGRASGVAFLDALRAGPPWPAIDSVRW
jgi:hypothetical protein